MKRHFALLHSIVIFPTLFSHFTFLPQKESHRTQSRLSPEHCMLSENKQNRRLSPDLIWKAIVKAFDRWCMRWLSSVYFKKNKTKCCKSDLWKSYGKKRRPEKKMTEVQTSQHQTCELYQREHISSHQRPVHQAKTRNPASSLGGNRLEEVTSC